MEFPTVRATATTAATRTTGTAEATTRRCYDKVVVVLAKSPLSLQS